MSYFIMPRPFFDFLAIQFARDASISDREKLNKSNFCCEWLDPRSAVITYHNNKLNKVDQISTLFSGYAYDKDSFFYDNTTFKDEKEAAKCFELTGKFSFLQYRNGVFNFCTDTFGQGVLFYYSDSKVSLVANRLHLIVQTLKKLGTRLEIDIDTVMYQSFFDIYIFNAYCSSKNLFLRNLKQLGVDENLKLEGGVISIDKKNFYEKIYRVSESDYEEYLETGAQELKDFFIGVKEKQIFDSYLLDVSGGKDSRVIVAGMLAAGLNPEAILAQTYATASPLDDKIGIAITEHFGMQPTSSVAAFSPRIPVEINDYVDCFLSFFAGTYYLFNAGGVSSFGQATGVARFAGTSSNVLRAGSSNTLKGTFSDLVTSDVELFFDRLTVKFGASKLFGEQGATKARAYLRAVLADLPGGSVPEKLEAIHHNYGSRYHGGLASIFQSWIYGPVFNPILTKGLYGAAQSLDLNDRVDGRLFFDIVYKLMPELAAFNFDKEFPYADEKRKHLGIKPITISGGYKTAKYYQSVRKQKDEAKFYFLTDKTPGFGGAELYPIFQERFSTAWSFFADNYSALTTALGDRYRKNVIDGLGKERESAKRKALVLISMAHVLS